uniref:RRM domain-containing protein n=1 Tax=Parascaris univalens TaxID=6257 RepID=A0A915BQ55_PARUN
LTCCSHFPAAVTENPDGDSLFDLAASLLPTCGSANVLQPYLSVSPQLSAVMYPSGGGRPLRSGYGFPGDTAAGSYPLVGGMHPGGVFGGNPQPLKQREISFDTSSKEPHLIRARVFVGNMNTNAITREDIIRLFSAYGTLLGVTLFKGYAFIQYGNANEADLAVSVLNGYNWNGSILDVKLAIAGMKPHNASSVSSANGVKRSAEGWPSGGASTKKERIDEYSAAVQNERNRSVASIDVTQNTNLYQSGMPDTMICGCCRFVTSDFEQFREHRKAPCASITKPVKDRKWQCSMCQEAFDDAAVLVDHALDRHNIRLLKVTE